MKKICLFVLFALYLPNLYSQEYKTLMNDFNVNFYDVCVSAELYFEENDKGKGSGYKQFQRWRNANECKYYPSGDRNKVNYNFVVESFQKNKSASNKSIGSGWIELGPFAIDNLYEGEYSPGLGRIEDFHFDPTDDNLIYLSSKSSGLWKTVDGGANWTGSLTSFLPVSGVNTFTVSNANSNQILINSQSGRNEFSHGIYRSLDGGDSWELTEFNIENLGFGGLGSNFKVNEVVYHPLNPDIIFVSSNEGLYRSNDNLQTWSMVYDAVIDEIEFHPTNENYIYFSYGFGLESSGDRFLLSNDLGLSFEEIVVTGDDNNYYSIVKAGIGCESCIYCHCSSGVWKSNDLGETFELLTNGFITGFFPTEIDSIVIGGHVDMSKSTDGGVSFSQITYWNLNDEYYGEGSSEEIYFLSENYIHADIRKFQSINGNYYVATDGFLSKSEDQGLTWEKLSNGISIRENYACGVSQSNTNRSIVGSQDNGTTIFLDSTWIEYFGADGMQCLIHPLNDDWMAGSFQNSGRIYTKDGGQTSQVYAVFGIGAWDSPFFYDPNNHMVVYDFRYGINKNSYFGDFNNTTLELDNSVQEAAIAENNSNILMMYFNGELFKSNDGGFSIFSIQNNLPNYLVTDIAFDPNNDETVIVTFATYENNGEKVFISYDGGQSWNNITFNLNDMPIYSVVIDHSEEANIYLGGEIGVYTKPMSGNSWELYNEDLPNVPVTDFDIVSGSNTLRASTWGRGLWESCLLGKDDYPAINYTTISILPTHTAPLNTDVEFVTSTISYEGVLSEVYLEWSFDEPTFGNVISMTNTSADIWESDTSLPLSNGSVKMFFKVFAIGENNDTTETYKFMYTTHSSIDYGYCMPESINLINRGISEVHLNTINKFTETQTSYHDYTDTDSTTLLTGVEYEINVKNTRFSWTELYIDWNGDLDFDDTLEFYSLGLGNTSAEVFTTLSPLTILVPENAFLGEIRMRVVSLNFVGIEHCETYFEGEIEDYKLIITGTPTVSYEIENSVICEGGNVVFTFTGTPMDSLSWNLTSGFDQYFSSANIDTISGLSSGIYNLTLNGYFDGDSTVVIDNNLLEVYPSYQIDVLDTICLNSSYVFPDGSFIENIDESIIQSSSLFTISTNCDSTITTSLFIVDIENDISFQDNYIGTNNTEGTYQWVDCLNDNFPIENENNQSFLPNAEGEYAVIVTENDCIDISECYVYLANGINEISSNDITIHPNPSDGIFILESEIKVSRIEIFDVKGKLVYTNNDESDTLINIDMKSFPSGVYFVKVFDGQYLFETFEIVKK